ncbi:MAG: glycoside hydrolase family 78 protein [Candidatus Hinthialibacter antarcticus]|nr:glycoside hydrolase family 78 protein [Candidatus Hinthialibacter antarcticus]
MKSSNQNVILAAVVSCFAIIILLTSVASSAETDMQITRLRCEYLENPLSIDEPSPRLSWELLSNQRGQKQSAYQVLVASNEEILSKHNGNLWDTGKVKSDASIHIAYDGKPLQSQMQCFWKVRVWDADGEASAWSQPAFWGTGLLKPSDWKAKWVGWDHSDPAPEASSAQDVDSAKWIWHVHEKAAQAAPVEKVYFRRVVNVEKDIESASILATADNSFKLWVNAEIAGTGGNFNQLYEIDLNGRLHKGKNTIAVEATNDGAAPNPAGFIAILQIKHSDGSEEFITTDAGWKSRNASAAGWTGSEFDDFSWNQAIIAANYGDAPWGKAGMKNEALDRRLSARYLRRDFNVDKKVKRAVVYGSGLGLSEFYLNGEKLGDHVLSQGLTDYDKRVLYVAYDVTDQLNQGDNALGAILGNGRYFAPRLTVPTETRTYGYPKLLLQTEIEYQDGTKETIASDSKWMVTTEGPIGANNEYDGEEYDARKEMPGWSKPGFDDSSWNKVEVVEAPSGELRAEMIEPIRVTETIKPIAVTNSIGDVYIFDMGQNMVGWCRLKVRGPKGTQVRLRHAEVLKDDGTLYLDNIRSAKVTDVYTLKGDGVEEYEPRFTYHGFRYVEVTGYPGEPALDAIEGCVVHDDVEPVGEFICSDPILNQIRENIRWGVRGNYRSFPTDCPQRDERQAWLGDRAAESKGETYFYNVAQLYRKWMGDMNEAQKDSGSVPSVAPNYWPMYPNDVTWPSCFLITPSSLLVQYADVRVLEERYDGMKRWIEFMSQYLEDGIMPRDTYGDWCVPPESPELIHSKDPSRQTAKPVLGTTYFYYDLKLMQWYAETLGINDDAKEFSELAETIRDAFNKKFYNEDEGYYDNGSQTSHVLPLAFGMVPKDQEERVFNNLVKKIEEETNGHVGTGLIGGQWLMRTLSDHGRSDLAFRIATQTAYPSWGYMIEQGATTIWELWNGNTADPAMNSGNHVMLVGDLYIWMNEYLAGIQADPKNPGFKHIIMKPRIDNSLTFCNASYHSIHGEIISEWKKENGAFIWKIKVPVNTTAEVSVPANDAALVKESGVEASKAKGVSLLKKEDGRMVYRVESGEYQFTAKL